jgi:isoquinoline 1-oxidoreductase alpha subunit
VSLQPLAVTALLGLNSSKEHLRPLTGRFVHPARRAGPLADLGIETGRFTVAKLSINGKTIDVTVEDDTPLLWVIREQIGLTGTKYGCGVAQCGACTVHIDGVATRSCTMPVSALTAEQKIVTIEGLSPDGNHPIQKAWIEHDVPQCGFCQSGMIMAAAALLQANPKPSDADIASEITNICRCGTYNRVKAAIKDVAAGGQMNRG